MVHLLLGWVGHGCVDHDPPARKELQHTDGRQGQKVRGGRSQHSCTLMMSDVFLFFSLSSKICVGGETLDLFAWHRKLQRPIPLSSSAHTDQHSSHYGGHGVPPLSPVDALALRPAEVIQEASHGCPPHFLPVLLHQLTPVWPSRVAGSNLLTKTHI